MVEVAVDEVMAIARAVVRRYYWGEVALREDLIGESVAGVLKACEKFDEGRGGSFSTFAYKCAKNEVAMYLRRERKWRELLSERDVDVEGVDSGEEFVVRPQENLDRLKAVGCYFKRDRDKAIVADILSGEKMSRIAEKFGISRQSVSRVFVKMKAVARKMFKYEEGEVIEK